MTQNFFIRKFLFAIKKNCISTYLFLCSIPHNYVVTTVDQIFHNATTHDAESKKTKFEIRWKNIFIFESLRHSFNIKRRRNLKQKSNESYRDVTRSSSISNGQKKRNFKYSSKIKYFVVSLNSKLNLLF